MFTDFLVNLETITAFNNRKDILEQARGNLNGIVFGRVDFSESLGIGREGIHSDQVTENVIEIASMCKENNLDLVVGGAVSADSIDVLKKISSVYLTRFETRKIVFDSDIISYPELNDGLINAVHFELLWLQNKKSYYSSIEREDDLRIKMLDERWKILKK